jgi:hypothetical protein
MRKAALQHNGEPVGSSEPEIARLMSRIAIIRATRTERMQYRAVLRHAIRSGSPA